MTIYVIKSVDMLSTVAISVHAQTQTVSSSQYASDELT